MMKLQATPVTIPAEATSALTDWPELRRERRVIVVVDVVESVRLMQADEADVIDRWRRFVNEVRTQLLPKHGGRLVKSLGDGLLLEFALVPQAVECAFAVQSLIDRQNIDRVLDQCLRLRIGVHATEIVSDELDVYGSGVNLAARIATVAEGGEITVTTEVRDELVAGLDANLEDLGECFLKHLAEPVRVYRLHARQEPQLKTATVSHAPSMHRTIAVIPFKGRQVSSLEEVVGELIADNVIARISTSPSLRVISRLSTSPLRFRDSSTKEIGALLGADFVVSGTYRVLSDRVLLMVELAEAATQEVVWAESLHCPLAEILNGEDTLTDSICSGVANAIAAAELQRARSYALPTLDGFSLQLAGMGLMHRSSRTDFNRAREVLECLVERYPRAPEPRAWLAKWYVLRVTLGLVENLTQETGRALEQTRRALDLAPECSMALAIEGFVHCHMLRDLDGADQRLNQSLELNPNESLAWLYKCVVQGFRNDGTNAMLSADRAIDLSPLDPMRHYYDGLAASAALSVGRLDRVIELASRSLRVNRNHTPVLRALAIAQVESGALEPARQTVARILELDPELTVQNYIARGPKGAEESRLRYARALREAGVPAA